jgi:hypothetical protein
MTNPTQQIAEVLGRHQWWFTGNLGVPGMPDSRGYKCTCGWEVCNDDGQADPQAHVASEVVAALGLHLETLASPPQGVQQQPGKYQIGPEPFPIPDDWPRRSRWVSAWRKSE